MNIVFLNPSGNLGGAETSLLNLLADLREQEPRWTLSLILGEPGPLEDKAGALGATVAIVPLPGRIAELGDSQQRFSSGPLRRASLFWSILIGVPAALRYARRLAATIRGFHPAAVHATGFKMHWFGYLACPRDVPLICHVHDFVQPRPAMRRLLRVYSHGCKALIANSNAVASDVGKVAARGAPILTIYNGVNLARFSETGDRWPLGGQEPPSDMPILKIGFIATFARWKGHFVFLQALSKLPPDIKAIGYIVGGPIYSTTGSQLSLDELRQEIERLGIEDRIQLLGFVDDIPAVMRALDVVVHASTEPEPFGMTIVEAMATGRPVVASQAGGAQELFKDGVDALGHRPGDAGDLARQLERLARDPELRRRLGEEARRTACRRFDQRALASEFRSLYSRMAQPSVSPAKTIRRKWREASLRLPDAS